MPRITGLLATIALVSMVGALAGCTAGAQSAPAVTHTVGSSGGGHSSAEATPEPTPDASDEAPRDMKAGDCLNKIAVDELGLPIPEYLDCAEPHMFEVTAIVETSKAGASFDFDPMDRARKDRCRSEYESYTGRNSRDTGNAFGWDQPTKEAWDAGVTSYPCYATAPGFGDLTGSVAR